MPFTFAHPAIVLPLAKVPGKYLSLRALIIGSMVPDFEYFFRLKIFSSHSHHISGLFYFDLPVGLLLYFLFVQLVRVPLIIHLPPNLRERFNYSFREKNLIIVIISVFAGALSHLFWDSFTHATGYFVEHLPFFQKEILISNGGVPMYKIFQHGSTIIGLLVIIFSISRMPRQATDHLTRHEYYWPVALLIMLLVFLGKYLTGNFSSFGDWVVTAISGALLGLLISSIIYHDRFPDRRTI